MIETLNLKHIVDHRGTMIAANSLPFEVKRVFFLKNVHKNRGSHAHKQLWEILIPIQGSAALIAFTRDDHYAVALNDSSKGVIVPPEYWRTLTMFSDDSIVLSLCSHELDENDYIRDYDEWYNFKRP